GGRAQTGLGAQSGREARRTFRIAAVPHEQRRRDVRPPYRGKALAGGVELGQQLLAAFRIAEECRNLADLLARRRDRAYEFDLDDTEAEPRKNALRRRPVTG